MSYHHTPAPWTIEPSAPFTVEALSDPGDGHPHGTVAETHFADDYGGPLTAEERAYRVACIGNAFLIAAAPDLLAAVEALLPLAGFDYMSDRVLRREHALGNAAAAPILAARDAIAAARGTSGAADE